ncbi:MAG: IS66 family insertion sequence element accessory protein TnpB [Nitrosomonas sp.]|nr:IS66 family insertion sequence element accessory protein TnpB [Nitrosomonas sp.]
MPASADTLHLRGRGIDGLSALVERVRQCSPCAESAFVFCNRAGNRIKVLLWDGGVWLCQRRLHQGRFVWQRSGDGGVALTQSQWEWLIAGAWIGVVWCCNPRLADIAESQH